MRKGLTPLQQTRAIPYKVRKVLNGPRPELIAATKWGKNRENLQTLCLRFSLNEWAVLELFLNDYGWEKLTSARPYSGHPEDAPDIADNMHSWNLNQLAKSWRESVQKGQCSEGIDYYELTVTDKAVDSPYGDPDVVCGVSEMISLLLWLSNQKKYNQEIWQIRWQGFLEQTAKQVENKPTYLIPKIPASSQKRLDLTLESYQESGQIESEEIAEVKKQLENVLPLPVFNPKDAWDLHQSLHRGDYVGEWPSSIMDLIYNSTEDLIDQDYYWHLYLSPRAAVEEQAGGNNVGNWWREKPWDCGSSWQAQTYEEYCLYLMLSCDGRALYEPQIGSYGDESDYQTGYYDPGVLCVADWHVGDMVSQLESAIIELKDLLLADPTVLGAQNLINDLSRELIKYKARSKVN